MAQKNRTARRRRVTNNQQTSQSHNDGLTQDVADAICEAVQGLVTSKATTCPVAVKTNKPMSGVTGYYERLKSYPNPGNMSFKQLQKFELEQRIGDAIEVLKKRLGRLPFQTELTDEAHCGPITADRFLQREIERQQQCQSCKAPNTKRGK